MMAENEPLPRLGPCADVKDCVVILNALADRLEALEKWRDTPPTWSEWIQNGIGWVRAPKAETQEYQGEMGYSWATTHGEEDVCP